jgi:hypothetical protein
MSYLEIFVPIMNLYLDDMEYEDNPLKVTINEYYYRLNPAIAQFQFIKIA